MALSLFQLPCVVHGLAQELGGALYGSEDWVRSPSSATIKSDYFLVQCWFFVYFSCPGNDFHDPTSAPSRNPTLQSLVENACRKALIGEKGLD